MDKKVVKKRFATEEQALSYIETLSMAQIKELLCGFLTEPLPEPVQKMTISAEEFEKHFRIREASGEGRKGRPRLQNEKD